MGIRKNKGRWTHEEHLAFLRGVHLYERIWEAVASLVVTRAVLQIRTHSQKYFAKIDVGGIFPEEPYPSQYDAAAGKAGVLCGAFVYDTPPQEQEEEDQQQQQQQQQQQAKPLGDNDAAMTHTPDARLLEHPPVFSQRQWGGGDGGNFGGEVEPCPPRPSLLVGGEQQQAAEAVGPSRPASGVDAGAGAGASWMLPSSAVAFPSRSAGDGGNGGGSPHFGFGFEPSRYDSAGAASGVWLGRSSGSPHPVRRGSAMSPMNNDGGGDNNSSSNTDTSRSKHNSTTAPAACSSSSCSSSSSSSFPSALSSTASAIGCASRFATSGLAAANAESFLRAGCCPQRMGGVGHSGGGGSHHHHHHHHQRRAGFNPSSEILDGFSHGARGEAGCRVKGVYPRQGGGSFEGSGSSSGQHQQHQHQHQQQRQQHQGQQQQQQPQQHHHQQWDLGVPLVLDDPSMWGISCDGEPVCAEQGQQQQQQQHGVFDGAKRLDAPEEQAGQKRAPQVVEQDLLPFYGWFEGGVGVNGDFGDVEEEEEETEGDVDGSGNAAGASFFGKPPNSCGML